MYKDYNDHELLYLIGESNEEALNILYEKYRPIIELRANRYRLLGKKVGLEYNDLIQEGLIGLADAIKSYKDNKDVKFSSFANVCIERQILSILSYSTRKKHSFLNESYSLDDSIDKEGRTLLDVLFNYSSDPSVMIENQETKDKLYDDLYKELSSFEKNVLDLKLLGLEYKEIAALLDKSYKSVDSALQRIRFKLKKVISEK